MRSGDGTVARDHGATGGGRQCHLRRAVRGAWAKESLKLKEDTRIPKRSTLPECNQIPNQSTSNQGQLAGGLSTTMTD